MVSMDSIGFLSCIAQKRVLGLVCDRIKQIFFPVTLWLNSFKCASSLWTAAQVLAASIVYRGSPWFFAGRQIVALGVRWGKKNDSTSVREGEWDPGRSKLAPERDAAGVKVLDLLSTTSTRSSYTQAGRRAAKHTHTRTHMHGHAHSL